jgi:hypothetical protein
MTCVSLLHRLLVLSLVLVTEFVLRWILLFPHVTSLPAALHRANELLLAFGVLAPSQRSHRQIFKRSHPKYDFVCLCRSFSSGRVCGLPDKPVQKALPT